jgi:DNA-binding FadR family transcriptional regulator
MSPRDTSEISVAAPLAKALPAEAPVLAVERLRDPILRVLAGRIVNGELPPGTSAPPEQEICTEFGVSKTVSREITAALVAKGLIRVQHGRRPQVLPHDSWDLFDPLILEVLEDDDEIDELVADMHEVRMLLEPAIAASAAASRTSEDLVALEAAMARWDELRGTTERFQADVDFHVVLARAAGNRILIQMMDRLRGLMRVSVSRRVKYLHAYVSQGGAEPEDFHRRIYEAIEARDPDAAREAMRTHMFAGARRLDAGSKVTATER